MVRSRSEEEWWFISRKTDEPISAEEIMLKERYVFESRHRTTHTVMKVSGLRRTKFLPFLILSVF